MSVILKQLIVSISWFSGENVDNKKQICSKPEIRITLVHYFTTLSHLLCTVSSTPFSIAPVCSYNTAFLFFNICCPSLSEGLEGKLCTFYSLNSKLTKY